MPEVEIPDPHEVKEKAEDPFAKRVALVVAVYAVALAIAGLGGNDAGKEMLMNQQEASNQWAYYQAKAIREALYLVEAEKIELDLARGDLSSDAKLKAEKTLARIKGKLEEYKGEKAEIMEKAREHEKERDTARRRDPYFDFAEVMLQIAIVLATVAILSGRRWPFFVSLMLALVGVALTANGFGLFVKVPGLEM
jgi:hypothetical protein